MAIRNYMKNLGKSVGMAGVDAIKELNPVISSTAKENTEFIKENYGKIKEYMTSDSGGQNEAFRKTSKKLISNALKELRSGELYSKNTKDNAFNDMAEGFGFNMKDFDFDFSEFDEEKEGVQSKSKNDSESFFDSSKEKDMSSDGKVDISNNTTQTLNRNITNNVMMSNGGGKATNKILSSSSKAMLQANMQSTSALLKGIHSISSFQNENTVKFYNDVSEKLADIGNSLNNMSKMFSSGEDHQDVTPQLTDLEDLMLNGLKLDFYKRRLAKKSSQGSGDIGFIFSMLQEMALPIFQEFASNPTGTLLKSGMKALLPKNFKRAFGRMNDSLQSLPLALQFLFRKWEGSDNKLKKGLAGLFGFDFAKTPKLDFGKYNKGAIAFDGVTKRAITNVIPSLLSKILSAVSNDPLYKEELVYDYEKGKFTTKTAIRKNFKGKIQEEAIDTHMGSYKDAVMSKFSSKDLKGGLDKEINNAFRKILNQGLIPDSSLVRGTLSSNKQVEQAIRKMYAELGTGGNRKFQNSLQNGLLARNNIYKELIGNVSSHNAYDIDTSMMDENKKREKDKAKRLKSMGITADSFLGSLLGLEDDGPLDNRSGFLTPVTKIINGVTDKLEGFMYGDNDKGAKIRGKSLRSDRNDIMNASVSGYRGNYKNNMGRFNIQTGIVNVYAGAIGSMNDTSAITPMSPSLNIKRANGIISTNYAKKVAEEIVNKENKKPNIKRATNIVSAKRRNTNSSTTNTEDEFTIGQDEEGNTTMKFSGKAIVNKLKEMFINPIKKFITNKIMTPVGNFFKKKIVDPIKKLGNKTKDYFMDVIWKPIREAFEPLKQRMKDWFGKKKQGLKDWFSKNIMKGKTWGEIWQGFKEKADKKVRTGVGHITGAMGDINKKFDENGNEIKDESQEETTQEAKPNRRFTLRRFKAQGKKVADDLKSKAKSAKDIATETFNMGKDKASKLLENGKDAYYGTKGTLEERLAEYKKAKRMQENKTSNNQETQQSNNTSGSTAGKSWQERIPIIDKNVNTIKDTLIDFYNAYLSANGIKAEIPKERSKGGRFGRIKDLLMSKVNSFKEFFKNPIDSLKGKFKGKFGFLTDLFGIPKKMFNGLMDMGKGIKNTVKSITDVVAKTIPSIIDGVKGAIGELYSSAKGLVKSIGKGIKSVLDGAMEGVKTLYGDVKSVFKEVWGTAKSAVGTVWDRFFGDGSSRGRKNAKKKMEVVISGGYLDGIREVVNVSLKKKTDSYADTKAKMLAEAQEDSSERAENEAVGDEGREGNQSRIQAYRERLEKWMGQGMDWVKDKIKNSAIGQSFFRAKNRLGTKLAGNTMRGPLGSIGRMVGRGMTSPAQLAEAGITAVHVTGSDIPMGTDTNSLVDAFTGGKNGKGGFMGRMMSKFMDSKLGGKFFNTKIGSKALDLATNGKGFFGNAKSLWTGANSAIMNTKVGGMLGSVGGKVAGVGTSALGKLAGMGSVGSKAAGLLGSAGSMLGGAVKFLGPIGLALTAGKGIFDGVKGWKNAGKTFGTKDATFGQKLSSTGGSILSGLSLGLLDQEKSAKFLHKAGTFATNLIPGVGMYRWGKKKLEENKKEKRAEAIKEKQAKQRAKQKLEDEKKVTSDFSNKKSGLFGNRRQLAGQSDLSKDETKLDKNGVERVSEKSNIGGGIIPFVSPILFQGRNLITAFRHNKKKEEEAEKKLLQQMSPEEREEYLASKSNSNILKGTLGAINPLGGLLSKLFGGGNSGSKKQGIFSKLGKSFKKFGNSVLGLLGISAAGGADKVSSSGGFKGFWQKMKNAITGKGWKTDEEIKNSNSGGSSGGGSGTPISIKNIGDIWKLSAKYEVGYNGDDSAAAARIANNAGDYGGKSYGIPQFSLNMGSLQTFVNSLKTTKPEWYARLSRYSLGSSGFDNEWKSIAQTNGTEFATLQNEAIKDGHYGAFVNNNKGILDITKRSNALQSAMWSTAVQFGGGSSVLKRALEGKNPASMSDADITRALYAEKRAGNGSKWFSSSSSDIQRSVVDRFHREEADVLALIDKEGDTKVSTASSNSRSMTRNAKSLETAHANPTPISTYSRNITSSPMSRVLSQDNSPKPSVARSSIERSSIPVDKYVGSSSYRSNSNTSSSISSSYNIKDDSDRMFRYTEMLNIMNRIANNTGVTNELLDKMFKLIDKKFKDDDKYKELASKQEQQTTRSNPFITGIDPDIEAIAQGV